MPEISYINTQSYICKYTYTSTLKITDIYINHSKSWANLKTCAYMFIAALFVVAKMETTQMFIN